MKVPTPNDRPFEWSDAWVFASVKGATDESGLIVFPQLIAGGDILNHAIFTMEELRGALTKLHMRGLVHVADSHVTITPLAISLHNKIGKMHGGLFSTVDNALKVLNSRRTRPATIQPAPDVDFVTGEFMAQACRVHARSTRRGAKQR